METILLPMLKLALSAFEFTLALVLMPAVLHRRAEPGSADGALHRLFAAALIKSALDVLVTALPVPLAVAAALAGAAELAVVTLWFLFFAAYLWDSPQIPAKAIRLSAVWIVFWLMLLAAAALGGSLPGQHGAEGGGALYYALGWLAMVPVLLCEALLIGRHDRLHGRDIAVLATLPLPAALGLALAYLLPGLPWKCPGLAFGLLAAHLYLQSRAVQKDPLTGAYTRAWFKARLAERTRDAAASPFLLLMLDLDNFKKINDTWGHMEGDAALVTAVGLLKKSLRSADAIARFAGDEFLVMASLSNPGECDILLRRIRDNLLQYNLNSGKPYTLSWSTGSLYCDKPRNPEELLAAVDEHMYRAKKQAKK